MSGPPFKKRFADSCLSKVREFQNHLEADVDYSQLEKGKPLCFKKYNTVSMILPSTSTSPELFKQSYYMSVLDLDTKADLQRSKVINWCRTAKPLYPVRTKADGNCMLNAVSLALWAIEDDKQFLRRLLYVTLVCDQTKNFHKRWLLQQRNICLQRPHDFNPQLNSRDWNQKWETIIQAATDAPLDRIATGIPYETLEGIHLYVFANILKRPIVLLADKTARSVFGSSIQENDLSGLYLPLEWDSTECCKSPIVIGYNLNHFTPLVAQHSLPNARAMDGKYVIPLINHNFEPLPLQFLLPNEEMVAHELITSYLKTENIPLTLSDAVQQIPVAKAEYQAIHDQFDIVHMHKLECEQIFSIWSQRDLGTVTSGPSRVPFELLTQASANLRELHRHNIFANNELMVVTNPNTYNSEWSSESPHHCMTPGCEMFGSPSFGNRCSTCFRKYTVQYNETEESRRRIQNICLAPSAPPPSMPVQESMYDLSMMGEKCHNECGNRCSVKTYPLCHECYDRQRPYEFANLSNLGPHVQPPTVPCAVENEIRPERGDDQNLYGERAIQRKPGLPLQGQDLLVSPPSSSADQICVSPNCERKSVSEIGNKCAECFIKFGSGDFLSLSSGDPLNEEPSSQTYIMNLPSKAKSVLSGGTPSPGDSKVLPRFPTTTNVEQYQVPQPAHILPDQHSVTCKRKDCNEYRFEHLDNFCEKCYEKEHGCQGITSEGSRKNKTLCSTPGCNGQRMKNPQNYCSVCIGKSMNLAKTAVPPPENSTLESKTPMGTSELPKERVVTSSKEKVKCASPLCNSLIYPPKQLCDNCVEILQKNYAATVPGSSRSRSLEIHREQPTKQGSAYSPSRQKCTSERCEYYGDKRFQGRCSQCEKDRKITSSPLMRVQPQFSNLMPNVGTVAQQAQKCVEPGCDKYGDPNMYFRCSDHFRIAVSQPVISARNYPLMPAQIEQYNIAENAPPPFRLNYVPNIPVTAPSQQPWPTSKSQHRTSNTVANSTGSGSAIEGLRKVENSRRGLKCKMAGCTNYGNSQKEGFCNSCYQNVQTRRNQTPHDEFGSGNYHCC